MRVFIAFIAISSVAIVAQGREKSQEPTYDGKPLNVLLQQLKNGDIGQRRLAATTLANRLTTEAKDVTIPLALALKDDDRKVRTELAKAVVRLGTPGQNAVIERLLDDIDREGHRVTVIRALGDLGTPARGTGPNVLRVMQAHEKNKVLQVVGARTVIELDNRSARTLLTVLINGLKDGNRDVRRHAAEGLGELGGLAAGKATQPLIDALKDSDEAVRQCAAWALARVDQREAARSAIALAEILVESDNESTRVFAMESLAELGNAARPAVNILRSHLKDPNPKKRLAAVGALYAIDPKTAAADALPILVTALKDQDLAIRTSALVTLKQIGPEAKSAIPEIIADLKSSGGSYAKFIMALDPLVQIGTPAIPALTELLRDQTIDLALVRAVIESLGKLGPVANEATPTLVQMLREQRHVLLHRFIVSTLGRIGPEALPTLQPLLSDSESRIQILAIQAIGAMGPEAKSMVAELRKFKRPDAPDNVKSAVDAALRQIESTTGRP